VVECLPSKCEALNSNPSNAEKEKEKEKKKSRYKSFWNHYSFLVRKAVFQN
jgi:hypothetical protein